MIGNCIIHIDHRPSTRRILNRRILNIQEIRISARAPSKQKSDECLYISVALNGFQAVVEEFPGLLFA